MDTQRIIDIWKKIESYQKIIIHHHVMKDYDALGSSFGLKELILSVWSKKQVHVVGANEPRLSLVPPCEALTPDYWQGALVIVCDCSNTARIDGEYWHLGEYLIKIDHHEDFQPFGNLSWVDTGFVATSEMVIAMYEVAREFLPVQLNEKARLYLYYGILTDTNRFHFIHSHQAAPLMKRVSLLLEPGDLSPFDITNDVYRYSESEVRIDGFIKLQYERPIPQLAFIKITQSLLEEKGWIFGEVRGKVNSMMGISGVRVWALFIENIVENKIHVELRSSQPTINTLAHKYGGGGHRLASGCKLENWDIAQALIEDLKIVATEE